VTVKGFLKVLGIGFVARAGLTAIGLGARWLMVAEPWQDDAFIDTRTTTGGAVDGAEGTAYSACL
jgi:hypothetical protein